MGKGENMNTVESWDIRSCSMDETKQKKLNGRRYKEWLKSLVKAKGSGWLVCPLVMSFYCSSTQMRSRSGHELVERVDFLDSCTTS